MLGVDCVLAFAVVGLFARGSSVVRRFLGVARTVSWRRGRVSLVVRLRAS